METFGVRECVSSIVGVLLSYFVLSKWIVPLIDDTSKAIGTVVSVAFVLFTLSFAIACYVLIHALKEKDMPISLAFFGLSYPLYVVFLSRLMEQLTVADFWFNLIGCVLLALFTSALIEVITDSSFITVDTEEEQTMESTDENVAPTTIPISTFVDFDAQDELKERVASFALLVEEATTKQTGNLEALHNIEKMKSQFEKSKQAFLAVKSTRKAEAENVFLAILTSMEQEVRGYIESYEQQQLRVLESVLHQRG